MGWGCRGLWGWGWGLDWGLGWERGLVWEAGLAGVIVEGEVEEVVVVVEVDVKSARREGSSVVLLSVCTMHAVVPLVRFVYCTLGQVCLLLVSIRASCLPRQRHAVKRIRRPKPGTHITLLEF